VTDTVYVKGLAELQKFLDQLPAKLERNVMRGALRVAAKDILLPATVSGAQKDTGALASSLRVSVRAKRGEVRAAVKTDLFYARLVEYGTRPHIITSRNDRALSIGGLFFVKAVEHPGIVSPKPFMRPALDGNATAATVRAGEYVKARLATKHGLDTGEVVIEAEEGQP
jgi:HK97 gp10 family phage protein